MVIESGGLSPNTARFTASRDAAALADRGKGGLKYLYTSDALQEILLRSAALGKPDLARQVYDLFVEICPVVPQVTLADIDRARDLLCDGSPVASRVALHAAVMLNHRIEWVATFDEGFDKIPGLRRMKL